MADKYERMKFELTEQFHKQEKKLLQANTLERVKIYDEAAFTIQQEKERVQEQYKIRREMEVKEIMKRLESEFDVNYELKKYNLLLKLLSGLVYVCEIVNS